MWEHLSVRAYLWEDRPVGLPLCEASAFWFRVQQSSQEQSAQASKQTAAEHAASGWRKHVSVAVQERHQADQGDCPAARAGRSNRR